MEYRNKAPDRSVYDALAAVMKAIGNGRRLELIELLAQDEHSVEVLARKAQAGITTVSSALQVLRQYGLVTTRREGTTVYYRLSGPEVLDLYMTAKRMAFTHTPQVRDSFTHYIANAQDVPVIEPSAVTSRMTVIDVRPRAEYQTGHFPGAVNMPFKHLPDRAQELPRHAEVVVYCRGELCRLAREAAALLRSHGIEAKAMREGVVEWRARDEHGFGRVA